MAIIKNSNNTQTNFEQEHPLDCECITCKHEAELFEVETNVDNLNCEIMVLEDELVAMQQVAEAQEEEIKNSHEEIEYLMKALVAEQAKSTLFAQMLDEAETTIWNLEQ